MSRLAFAAACLVLAPTLAHAEAALPKLARPLDHVPPPAVTSASHVIFMNNCLPNGCDLLAGGDDAANHQSSIATPGAHVSPWGYGAASWSSLVDCVKLTYAPFDITVVDTRPTTGRYHEIIVAGTPNEVNSTGQLDGAGGVAPFIGCGARQDNVITYMFAGLTSNHNYLCGGVAQETSHVFGLDHELNPDDPMTYLNLGSKKTFQDASTQCGEDTSAPHSCRCGGQQQNSYAYLMNAFGPFQLHDASLTITAPADGAWVKPGFRVTLGINDQLPLATAQLAVDAAPLGNALAAGPWQFDTPNIAAGDHTITVTATDTVPSAPRTLMASTTVHVMGQCDATLPCPDGLACLNGFCYPDASVQGGLGSTCQNAGGCLTGQCASDGNSSLCTGKCDAGKTCPDGFTCLDDGAAGVCWPAQTSSGGCAVDAGGNGGALAMLAGLGIVATGLRRRARA